MNGQRLIWGDKVTVRHGLQITRGRVSRVEGDRFSWSSRLATGVTGLDGEGMTWARGWDTEEALALQSVAALATED